MSVFETMMEELNIRDRFINELVIKLNDHSTLLKDCATKLSEILSKLGNRGARLLSEHDNIIVIDGLEEKDEKYCGKLTKQIMNDLNKNFESVGSELSPRDILSADGLGKKNEKRPRHIKTVFNIDWVKIDIMQNKLYLQGSDIHIKEHLEKPMHDLWYQARLAKKSGFIDKFYVRKRHVPLVPKIGEAGVEVEEQRQLTEVGEEAKAAKVSEAAKQAKKDRKKKKKAQKTKAYAESGQDGS